MGEVFAGRYELVDPIGHGGVGAVWRSWDHRRRRYVAAKVLQQSDAHALLRFVREQAMRIDHPHVLAPASWAADDDKVLFTMDLVRGGSLSHLIGDYGPLPPRLVCVLLDQLLAGLSAVHAEGVVHRDIKPANILLEATGSRTPHVRLSDFGIAMRKGDARLTETNYVVGTPGYFAPEQLLGAEPDFSADLYAAGLVALYLLGGQKPDAQALQERFLALGMPPAPLGVPGPLWQVVGTLLQPEPYARFRTATGARKALAAAVELLPEPESGEEPVEVSDQIGPLPAGFGPDGPTPAEPGDTASRETDSRGTAAPDAAARNAAARGVEAAASAPVAPRLPAPEPSPPLGSPGPSPEPWGQRQVPSDPLPAPRPAGRRQARHAAPQAPGGASASPEPWGPPPAARGAGLDTHPRTRLDAPVLPLPEPAPTPAPSTADTASAALPARRPKPGPPAAVVVPVLVLALLCFAVGIAALLAA